MADQLDNRPVFTIVMGCNGAGKSAWKRENYDRLPRHYFDQDSVAGGIGDWNDPDARARTREYVDGEIDRVMKARLDFGIESTYSGRPGREMVERAKAADYRVEGVYIGTDSPEINAERIRHRVESNTGHKVDPRRLPERYRFSLSNLRKTAEQFDTLEIMDNSAHERSRIPDPAEQLVLEEGRVTAKAEDLKPWCDDWLQRFERSVASRQPRERRRGMQPVPRTASDVIPKPPARTTASGGGTTATAPDRGGGASARETSTKTEPQRTDHTRHEGPPSTIDGGSDARLLLL